MTKQAKMRHQEALYLFTQSVPKNDRGFDKDLHRAVWEVVNTTTPSMTIRSRSNPLISPIRKHVDPIFKQWMSKIEIPIASEFSDIVKMENQQSHDLLIDIDRINRAINRPETNKISNTINLLIYFKDFCVSHKSDVVKKIYLDPSRRQTSGHLCKRNEKGYKAGARSNGKQAFVPGYLIHLRDSLIENGLCIACGDSTSAQIEFEVITDSSSSIDISIKKQIAQGVEFSSKDKGSRYYCPAHSERDGGSSGYKNGQKQIVPFLSLLFALEYNGIKNNLNDFLSIEENFLFAKKAIRSIACRSDLELVAQKISELVPRLLDQSATRVAKDDVVQAVRRMFFDHLRMK